MDVWCLIGNFTKIKTMKTKIVTLFAIVTTMVSCNNTKKTDSATDTQPSKKEMEADNVITDKYWKLITLDGKPVTMVDGQEKEVYFTLKSNDNTISGFAGCNNFNGTYELEEGNRIKFGTIATTMKSCDGVTDEHALLKVFDQADNYTLVDDDLSLHIGRRAPLAIFKAVFMKEVTIYFQNKKGSKFKFRPFLYNIYF